MDRSAKILSRRNFLKGAGLIATSSFMPGVLASSETENNNGQTAQYRVLCCNIRVALAEDETNGVGWNIRKNSCIAIIKEQKPAIIGLQEVLQVQNEDLKKAFPAYFSFGFEGPEMDEHDSGYHGIAKNPIFFSKKRFNLVSAGTFWLSETPLIGGSTSWGTARARNASWVRLMDRQTGHEFRVVNLHLDHVSQQARMKQIQLVLEEAKQYPKDFPQILTGDFNSSGENAVCGLVKASGWMDTYTAIHGDAEPGYTVHQFKGDQYEKKDKGRKIDFIFSKGLFTPIAGSIIRTKVNGSYPSDHYFVSADVSL